MTIPSHGTEEFWLFSRHVGAVHNHHVELFLRLCGCNLGLRVKTCYNKNRTFGADFVTFTFLLNKLTVTQSN